MTSLLEELSTHSVCWKVFRHHSNKQSTEKLTSWCHKSESQGEPLLLFTPVATLSLSLIAWISPHLPNVKQLFLPQNSCHLSSPAFPGACSKSLRHPAHRKFLAAFKCQSSECILTLYRNQRVHSDSSTTCRQIPFEASSTLLMMADVLTKHREPMPSHRVTQRSCEEDNGSLPLCKDRDHRFYVKVRPCSLLVNSSVNRG